MLFDLPTLQRLVLIKLGNYSTVVAILCRRSHHHHHLFICGATGLAEATRDRGNDAHGSHSVITISIVLPLVSTSIGIYLTLLLPLR